MYLPPLQMPVYLNQLIIGDVQVDSSAAIAPGVILQADPGSSIVIGAGVCIGMGVIIHAQNSKLAIGSGTSLGAGVLIVGQSEIGINCSVGSCVTIVNCNLESGSIVSAGSILDHQSFSPRVIVKNATEKNSASSQADTQQIPESQASQNQIANSALADPETNRTEEKQTDLNSEVSPSSAIALNHAKAHLGKFMSKIQLI